jgi:hypothetical protein
MSAIAHSPEPTEIDKGIIEICETADLLMRKHNPSR